MRAKYRNLNLMVLRQMVALQELLAGVVENGSPTMVDDDATEFSAQAVLARIQRRIAVLDAEARAAGRRPVTPRSVSIQASGSPETIRSIERNLESGATTGVRPRTIRQLMGPLRTTFDWLAKGSGMEDARDVIKTLPSPLSSLRKVRVVGYIAASGEGGYYQFADEDFEEVEAPLFAAASPNTLAFEIRGKSFGPLMEGMLVFIEDGKQSVTEDLIGQICVIGTADGRILLKQIDRKQGRWRLLSNNANELPIENVEIEWAAKILGFAHRRSLLS